MNDKKNRMMGRSTAPLPSLKSLQSAAITQAQGLSAPDAHAVEPTDLPIGQIAPDPIQPRRALPDLYRARWCAGELLPDVLAEWGHEAAVQRDALGFSTPWEAWLHLDDTPLIDPSLKMPPALRLWLDLLRLAGSIYRDGLAVPITVYQDARGYRLLMGERRLLAFWLLYEMGYDQFAHIPALVRDSYNPIAQAAENGARRNLNAISIARQLAVLLMVVNGIDVGNDTAQANQAWYAQALDLQVPSGEGEALATVLGLKNPRQISHYRRLLALPRVVWNWADEFDWTEGKIRGMVNRAATEDALIDLAQAEATKELGGTPKPTALPDRMSTRLYDRMERAMVATLTNEKALQSLTDAQRRRLRDLAKDLLKRL